LRSPQRAPTAIELANDPVVRTEIELAWTDSDVIDASARHEEGGWIYLDTTTGALTTRRAETGGQANLTLGDPPVVDGAIVVGTFHTHPNPSAEGWNPGPSLVDEEFHQEAGVPGLIRADDGIHATGPESRRGGLAGDPGFPQ
jgi:hypothetical protein